MSKLREQEEYVVTNRAHAEMMDRTACAIQVRHFPPLISDEPPSRGGSDRGRSPLELLLASLCACTNVTASRMAEKIRFEYTGLEMEAEGELDTRGRRGLADVPVHYRAVRLRVTITTDEPERRGGGGPPEGGSPARPFGGSTSQYGAAPRAISTTSTRPGRPTWPSCGARS